MLARGLLGRHDDFDPDVLAGVLRGCRFVEDNPDDRSEGPTGGDFGTHRDRVAGGAEPAGQASGDVPLRVRVVDLDAVVPELDSGALEHLRSSVVVLDLV